ncbi:MAG: leucine-rich repeat domain-containing protein [Clostridia bacterium]|nr:leucine-rich repeat domain-containing protein [Clostridia bacterium]
MRNKRILIALLSALLLMIVFITPVFAILFSSMVPIDSTLNYHAISAGTTTFSVEEVAQQDLVYTQAGQRIDVDITLANAQTGGIYHHYYGIKVDSATSTGLENAILVYMDGIYMGVLSDLCPIIDNVSIEGIIDRDYYILPNETLTKTLSFELHIGADASYFDTKICGISITSYAQTTNVQKLIFVGNEDEFASAIDDINLSDTQSKTLVLTSNITLTADYVLTKPCIIDLFGNELSFGEHTITLNQSGKVTLTSSRDIFAQTTDSGTGGFVLNRADSTQNDILTQGAILDMVAQTFIYSTVTTKYTPAQLYADRVTLNAYSITGARELIAQRLVSNYSNGIASTSSVDIFDGMTYYRLDTANMTITTDGSANYTVANGILTTATLSHTSINTLLIGSTSVEFKIIGTGNDTTMATILANELKHIPNNQLADVSYDLFLPTALKQYNCSIVWTSSNQESVSNTGKLSNTANGVITLTATIRINDEVFIQHFVFTAIRQNNETRFLYLLARMNPRYLSEIYDAEGSVDSLPIVDLNYNSAVPSNTPLDYRTIFAVDDLGIYGFEYSIDPAYYYVVLDDEDSNGYVNDIYLNQVTFQVYAQLNVKGYFSDTATWGTDAEESYSGSVGIVIELGQNTQLQDSVFSYIQTQLDTVDILQNIIDTRIADGMLNEKGDFVMPASYMGFNTEYSIPTILNRLNSLVVAKNAGAEDTYYTSLIGWAMSASSNVSASTIVNASQLNNSADVNLVNDGNEDISIDEETVILSYLLKNGYYSAIAEWGNYVESNGNRSIAGDAANGIISSVSSLMTVRQWLDNIVLAYNGNVADNDYNLLIDWAIGSTAGIRVEDIEGLVVTIPSMYQPVSNTYISDGLNAVSTAEQEIILWYCDSQGYNSYAYYWTSEVVDHSRSLNTDVYIISIDAEHLYIQDTLVPIDVTVQLASLEGSTGRETRGLFVNTPGAIHNDTNGFNVMEVFNSVKLQVWQQLPLNEQKGLYATDNSAAVNITTSMLNPANLGSDYILQRDIQLCQTLVFRNGSHADSFYALLSWAVSATNHTIQVRDIVSEDIIAQIGALADVYSDGLTYLGTEEQSAILAVVQTMLSDTTGAYDTFINSVWGATGGVPDGNLVLDDAYIVDAVDLAELQDIVENTTFTLNNWSGFIDWATRTSTIGVRVGFVTLQVGHHIDDVVPGTVKAGGTHVRHDIQSVISPGNYPVSVYSWFWSISYTTNEPDVIKSCLMGYASGLVMYHALAGAAWDYVVANASNYSTAITVASNGDITVVDSGLFATAVQNRIKSLIVDQYSRLIGWATSTSSSTQTARDIVGSYMDGVSYMTNLPDGKSTISIDEANAINSFCQSNGISGYQTAWNGLFDNESKSTYIASAEDMDNILLAYPTHAYYYTGVDTANAVQYSIMRYDDVQQSYVAYLGIDYLSSVTDMNNQLTADNVNKFYYYNGSTSSPYTNDHVYRVTYNSGSYAMYDMGTLASVQGNGMYITIPLSTQSSMDANAVAGNLGVVYKYTGTTTTTGNIYENGQYYVIAYDEMQSIYRAVKVATVSDHLVVDYFGYIKFTGGSSGNYTNNVIYKILRSYDSINNRYINQYIMASAQVNEFKSGARESINDYVSGILDTGSQEELLLLEDAYLNGEQLTDLYYPYLLNLDSTTTGMNYFVNLRRLTLAGSSSEMRMFSNAPKAKYFFNALTTHNIQLQVLEMVYCNLTDISTLGSLVNLTHLDLSNNADISNISSISDLSVENLAYLDIYGLNIDFNVEQPKLANVYFAYYEEHGQYPSIYYADSSSIKQLYSTTLTQEQINILTSLFYLKEIGTINAPRMYLTQTVYVSATEYYTITWTVVSGNVTINSAGANWYIVNGSYGGATSYAVVRASITDINSYTYHRDFLVSLGS